MQFPVQQGIEVAIDEINRAGGVLGGRKLALMTTDNRSITAVGLDNLRKLLRSLQLNPLPPLSPRRLRP